MQNKIYDIMCNPFNIKPYNAGDTFCGREKEIERLISNIRSGIDTTLISDRKLGKTGLIYRLIEEIESKHKDISPIYVDLFTTENMADFTNELAESILIKYPEKTSFGKKFINFLKSMKPQLSFDSITGEPQVEIGYSNNTEKEYTLKSLLKYLESQDTHILIAFDEFQQIRGYEEKNMEAFLRTYIQTLHNINFIFCGSKKHLMTDIFTNPQKPFYQSTQFMALDKLPEDEYAAFIVKMFARGKKEISAEAIQMIFSWTRRHTYYTQALCHTIYDMKTKKIDIDTVKSACAYTLEINESYFLQYRQLLTDSQWNFLIAVAKEDEVSKPTATEFLAKHKIGASSTALRILNSLLEKDLLISVITPYETSYLVADVFLSRWLARTYR